MSVPMSAAEIADDLADRIRDGEPPPGSKMPSYHELAVLYGVGTTTIANVMTVLKERGLVVGYQGRGVYVADRRR